MEVGILIGYKMGTGGSTPFKTILPNSDIEAAFARVQSSIAAEPADAMLAIHKGPTLRGDKKKGYLVEYIFNQSSTEDDIGVILLRTGAALSNTVVIT